MARFLRSYPDLPKLGAPIGLSPLARTTTPGQLQVKVTLAVHARRVPEKRRFPLQGWSGALTRASTLSDGGTQTLSLRKPLLGPRPPQLVTPNPTQRQQSIVTRYLSAVQGTRFRTRRGYPAVNGGQRQRIVRQTSLGVSVNLSLRDPLLGPRPPQIVDPLSTFVAAPIQVNLAAGIAANQRRAQQRRASSRYAGPVLVGALPTSDQTTIATTLIAVRRRIRQQRHFPLQGWEGWGAIDTLSGFTRYTPTVSSDPTSGLSFGRVVTASQRAVSFTGINGEMDAVGVALFRTGSPSDNFVLEIQTDSSGSPSGTVLSSASLVGSSISAAEFVVYTLPLPLSLNAAETYWIVLRRDGALDSSNYYTWGQGTVVATGSSILNTGVWITLAGAGAIVYYEINYEAPGGSKSFHGYQRLLGPRPPLVINPLPSQPQQTITVKSLPQAVVRREQAQQREPKSQLFPPATLAQPPPFGYPIVVNLAAARRPEPLSRYAGPVVVLTQDATFLPISVKLTEARPRRTRSALAAPAVVTTATFIASPIQVTIAENRTRGFGRRFPRSFLLPPVALQTFSGPQVNLLPVDRMARRQRRHNLTSFLNAPTVIDTVLVRTLRVSLTATRPRRTHSFLAPPTIIDTVQVRTLLRSLTHTRPRPTKSEISAPTVLQTFSGAQVHLQTIRPRHTRSLLSPPAVVTTAAQAFYGPQVKLTRQRRGEPFSRLLPPTVIDTVLVRTLISKQVATRPRPTTATLSAPTVIDTVLVRTLLRSLTTTRPRPTTTLLSPPQALRTFAGPRVSLVKTRPRPTTFRLSPPKVIRVPSVEQKQQTIQTRLARIRPPHTVARILAPTVLQTFSGAATHLQTIRPRKTHWFLAPPTTLQTFAAEIEEQILTLLAPQRPRYAPHSRLFPPNVLATFAGPKVNVTRIRPPSKSAHIVPPTVVRIPSVEQQQQTIKTWLTRTRPRPTIVRIYPPTVVAYAPVETTVHVELAHIRPRPTTHVLFLPTVLQTFAGPSVHLVATRPRPTRKTLLPPTVVRVPSVEQQQQTIRVALVRTTPRPTTTAINPPTVVRVPSVEQQLRTITARLVQTRPRPTTQTLSPPTVVARPPVGEIVATLVAVRTGVEQKRHYPLPGFRQRVVRETGSTVTCQLRDPFLGPRPPQIIDPLPNQQQQTIAVSLDAVRTRTEQKRHYPLPGFRQRVVRETGSTVTCQLRDPLLGPRPPQIIDPLPSQQQQTLAVRLVAVRTSSEQKRHAPHSKLTSISYRATSEIQVTLAGKTRADAKRRAPHSELFPPTVVERVAFYGPFVALAKTRPRPTFKVLFPPTIVSVPSVEQALRTIRVDLTRTRPRPTSRFLLPPTALRTFSGPEVALVRTLPRPTTTFLRAPTVVRIPSVEQRQQTITVKLAQIRPAQTRSKLSAPAFTPPVVTRITAQLTRTRPRATIALLLPLPVTAPARVVESKISVALVQPSGFRRVRSHLSPPIFRAPTREQQTIRTQLVRIRPRPTTALVQPPSVVAVVSLQQQTIGVSLSRIRPPSKRALLQPPTVVAAAATLAQQTILVKLAVEARLLLPRTKFRLARPSVLVIPLPGVTWGEDIAATAVEEYDIAASSASDEQQIAATSVQADDSAAVTSTIEDVAATSVESEDKEAGT